MYDFIIKNGKIFDGTGSESYISDIAVKDGKIALIEKNIEGDKIINAGGLCVTPGFIDSHSHSDRSIISFPDQKEKIEQGITTSIAGQCGDSCAPLGRDTEITEENEKFRTMGTFLKFSENITQGSNTVTFAGHRNIRAAVMGTENRAATEEELEKMKILLREALENGAFGLSFGLIYVPSCYAETKELIELAKVAAEYNGIIAAHIRNEGDELIESVREFIKIAEESGAKAVLSHLKAMKEPNFKKIDTVLKLIDEAVERGAEIYCDAYPYTASHTSLSARFIPKEYHSENRGGLKSTLNDENSRNEIKKFIEKSYGNDLRWVLITYYPYNPSYQGLTVSQISELENKDVYETVMDLVKNGNNICNACFFLQSEDVIEKVLKYKRTMICTDSDSANGKSIYHPRLRGSFPRVLGRYVREKNVTTLPEMIRKMTSLPAKIYGLNKKGLIKEGYDADICIFDSEKIIDKAEYSDCTKGAEGLNYVILNGKIVVENAIFNGEKAGKVILKQ